MGLNKRKCREFADPGLKMTAGNGLLHAKQIKYIVRTAVKIIDHHKTLILYVYPREQAAQGDFSPLYTVFQNREDFVTLEMKEDGSARWRTAAFEYLDGGYNFSGKCALYNSHDDERISNYFKDATGGFTPLIKAQQSILQRRSQRRQRKKESCIVSRMSCVAALPRGLKSWIHKSVMPAYFFYDYKRGGKDVVGVCSACSHGIILSGIRQGTKVICPHCKKELTAKPRSRRGTNMYDRNTVQVIQNTGDGWIIVRIVKIYYNYTGDTPDVQIYENDRQFIWQGADGKANVENYYFSYGSGILTDWKKGERPTYSPWQYSFGADTCGHLYTNNLPDALEGTPWQFCPILDFYNHFHEPMQILPFFIAYIKHSKMEHLIKTGFYSLASDVAYRDMPDDCLDESRNRTHQILQISPKDVSFLRDMDADISMLKTFQGYNGIKNRQKMFLWQLDHKVNHNVMPILRHMTVHKAIRYVEWQHSFLQLRKTPHGALRYTAMQEIVTEYRDYLEMCSTLGYDMKNSFVLYPKDLQKSHDKVMRRKKNKDAAKNKKDFTAIYKQIEGKLDFEDNGMKIVYPSKPDDMVAESHALHNCVDSYVGRVARKECVILFLRQCSDESKSFYTIEVRGQKAVQVRGIGNCNMTPEVQAFITA